MRRKCLDQTRGAFVAREYVWCVQWQQLEGVNRYKDGGNVSVDLILSEAHPQVVQNSLLGQIVKLDEVLNGAIQRETEAELAREAQQRGIARAFQRETASIVTAFLGAYDNCESTCDRHH